MLHGFTDFMWITQKVLNERSTEITTADNFSRVQNNLLRKQEALFITLYHVSSALIFFPWN